MLKSVRPGYDPYEFSLLLELSLILIFSNRTVTNVVMTVILECITYVDHLDIFA